MSGKKHLRRIVIALAIGSLPVLLISIRFDALGWWTHYPVASIAALIGMLLYEHPRRFTGFIWITLPVLVFVALLAWPSSVGSHAVAAVIGITAAVLKELLRMFKVQRMLQKSEAHT